MAQLRRESGIKLATVLFLSKAAIQLVSCFHKHENLDINSILDLRPYIIPGICRVALSFDWCFAHSQPFVVFRLWIILFLVHIHCICNFSLWSYLTSKTINNVFSFQRLSYVLIFIGLCATYLINLKFLPYGILCYKFFGYIFYQSCKCLLAELRWIC